MGVGAFMPHDLCGDGSISKAGRLLTRPCNDSTLEVAALNSIGRPNSYFVYFTTCAERVGDRHLILLHCSKCYGPINLDILFTILFLLVSIQNKHKKRALLPQNPILYFATQVILGGAHLG